MGIFNFSKGDKLEDVSESVSVPETIQPEEASPVEEGDVDVEKNIDRIKRELEELGDKDDDDSNEKRKSLHEQLDMIEGMSGPKDY